MKLSQVIIASILLESTKAFIPNTKFSTETRIIETTKLNGFLDDWKLVFSKEGQENIQTYNEQFKKEQEEAQEEIYQRRRNPELMEQYQQDVAQRRRKLMEEKEVWDFQNNVTGEDPMEEWDKLREEGKIQVGSDIPRDPTTSRLGSEGLQEVRIDERYVVYIDLIC